MLKTKVYLKGLLVVLGIVLTSGLTYAERDYMAEYHNLSDNDAKIAFIKTLTEDQLLVMGNQACIKDPTGELAFWGVVHCGLKPIFEQNPLQTNKYLPLIQAENLHPLWRAGLIGIATKYISYWNYEDTEQLTSYIFEYLKDPKGEIVLKRSCAANLDRLIYEKMRSIIESKELSIREKQQQVDKLHLKSASIIEYLVRLLSEGVEKDEMLRLRAIGTLRNFGLKYLTQKDAPPVEYRTGQAFDTAVRTAAGIGPAFGQILQRKDIAISLEQGTSLGFISNAIRSLINLDLANHIPSNLVGELKKDKRFSSEKDQDELVYWGQKIREARERKK